MKLGSTLFKTARKLRAKAVAETHVQTDTSRFLVTHNLQPETIVAQVSGRARMVLLPPDLTFRPPPIEVRVTETAKRLTPLCLFKGSAGEVVRFSTQQHSKPSFDTPSLADGDIWDGRSLAFSFTLAGVPPVGATLLRVGPIEVRRLSSGYLTVFPGSSYVGKWRPEPDQKIEIEIESARPVRAHRLTLRVNGNVEAIVLVSVPAAAPGPLRVQAREEVTDLKISPLCK